MIYEDNSPIVFDGAQYYDHNEACLKAADGGRFQIGTKGMETILVDIPLNLECGELRGGRIYYSGFPKTSKIKHKAGKAEEARILNKEGKAVLKDLKLGLQGTTEINIVKLDKLELSENEEVTMLNIEANTTMPFILD